MQTDFEAKNIPVFRTDERKEIYEDRLTRVLAALRKFNPTTVVGTLSAISFEVLRYMPVGIQRLGMIQSDDPGVYRVLALYRDCMDGIVGVSKEICKRVAFLGCPVHYVPYGVPMPEAVRPAHDGPLRILYLGRLDREQKRVHLFPEIHRQLMESGISFVWTIAGEGPERTWLEESMRKNVRFAGKVSYVDVPKLLRQQDVFLLTSDYEGLPLSLLEAMGQGLTPVVSHLSSGIPEVVNTENGFLVNPQNVAGYAEAIIELARRPDLLQNMSTAAQKTVRGSYSTAAMAKRWLSILQSAQPGVVWPETFEILPDRECRRPWLHIPTLRLLRRLAKAIVGVGIPQ